MATPLPRKLILVHKRALVGKYTAAGYTKIKAAIDKLIAADKKRGVASKLVLLDSKLPAGGMDIAVPSKSGKFKAAIDHVFEANKKPDYLMILGGPDIVPHVPLRNPVTGRDATDETADGDLPYACDRAHSLDASKFTAVTRVISRLPDVAGIADLDYLLGQIGNATAGAPPLDQKHFAISAEIWQAATGVVLQRALSKPSPAFALSPLAAPPWTKAKLAPGLHVINCHGAAADPGFYGEPSGGDEFPLALDSDSLTGRIRPGTVVAAECCYGAMLYPPDDGAPLPLPLAYLDEGAQAFMGATTIAYGAIEAADVGCADTMAAEFVRSLRAGATTGRAFLEARQALVEASPTLDVYELKTLAQFILLGDPAYRPYPQAVAPTAASSGVAKKSAGTRLAKSTGTRLAKSALVVHTKNRALLAARGVSLARETPVADKVAAAPAAARVADLKATFGVDPSATAKQYRASGTRRVAKSAATRNAATAGAAVARKSTPLPANAAAPVADTVLVFEQDRPPPPGPRIGFDFATAHVAMDVPARIASATAKARSRRPTKAAASKVRHAEMPLKPRFALVVKLADGSVVSKRWVTTR